MNMANMSSTSPLHFLLLPVPGQGHLNPMLALAENLQADGCTITVVLPEQSHRKILAAAAAAAPASHDLHESLHFVTFNAAEFSDFAGMMTVFKQQQGFLENLIESSKSTPTPISCIVSDFMLTWAQDVANKCGIPRALFWLCSATLFHIGTVARAAGGLYPGAPQLKELQQKLHVSARAMLEVFDPEDPAEKETMLGFYDRWDEPSHILINTMEALEGHVVPLLPSNARFIGPCLRPADAKMALSSVSDNGDHHQHDAVHQPAPGAVAARFGSLAKEDMACLSWLDQQEDSSVLYISFGSFATLPAAQLVEMALGIEASNHKFLWVAREGPINTDASTATTFPEGFLQRTRERGMVTSWAPQLQVLKHRAVGGFLTHCGWNSTMESIVMGVPMLCFPFFGDQPINEETIMGAAGVRQICMKNDEGQEEGKEALAVPAAAGGRPMSLGFGFEGRRNTSASERKSNYVVSREEVERAVRALLGDGSSDENHVDVEVMRENARHLMGHARRALHHDSHATLRSFIQDIRHLTTTSTNHV